VRREDATISSWPAMWLRGTDGLAARRRLRAPSLLTQWFAWVAYHPETDVVALSGAASRRD